MDLEWRQYFAKLAPRKVIGELHEQPFGPFDGRKERIRQGICHVDLLSRRPRCARRGCDETHRGTLHSKLHCRSNHVSGTAASAEIIPQEMRHWVYAGPKNMRWNESSSWE